MKTYISHAHTLDNVKTTAPLLHYDDSQELPQWQAAAKEKLTELLCLPLSGCDDCFTVTGESVTEEYREIRFEFQSEPGYFIPCHLLIPIGADKPLPGVICLQGHSTGKHISLGQKQYETDTDDYLATACFGLQAVRNGMCAIVFDQRYMGQTGHQDNGKPACLRNYGPLSAMMLGRTAIGERVWDVSRVIDIIQAHLTAHIDPDRIICLGNSGGGTATFYSACLDERIHLAVSSCAVCTYEDSIMAMFHCACNYIPGIRKYFEMGDLGCLIAPRKLILVNGDVDPIFPINGAKASYEVIKTAYQKAEKSENCCMVIGHGGHQFYPDETWPVIHNLLNQEV